MFMVIHYFSKYLTFRPIERPGSGRLSSEYTSLLVRFLAFSVTVHLLFMKLCSMLASIVSDVGILRS